MAEPEAVGQAFIDAINAVGPFAIRVGDTLVRLIGLQPQLLAGVQRASGVPWVQLVESPTADLAAALMLVAAAEQQCGIEASPVGTVVELMDRFVKMPATGGES